MPVPGCTRKVPVPCRAQDRLPPHQPAPGQKASPPFPIPSLLPPGGPANSAAAGAPAHGASRLTRRRGLVMAAVTTWLYFGLAPEEQTFAQRSRPVVRRLPSQSHRIGDSFPSRVQWMAILSIGVGHVTPFLSSCCPPAFSHHARGFWLSLCGPRLPPALPGGTLPPYRGFSKMCGKTWSVLQVT